MGVTMSRVYLTMLGRDLLLAISLFVLVNLLILGSAINSDALAPFNTLTLVTLCLLLLGTKYGLWLHRMHQPGQPRHKPSLLNVAGVALLPGVVVVVFYLLGTSLPLPDGVPELSLVVFCLIQLLLFSRQHRTESTALQRENVLVLGTGPLALQMAKTIDDSHDRYNFCGYVHPDAAHATNVAGHAVATTEQILQTVRDQNINRIVVALAERRGVLPVREMFSCKLRGVDVVDAATFYEKTTGKLLIEHTQPGWFVFSNGFLVTRLMFKKQRLVDILAAGTLLLLTLPLFPLIALAIRLESPGEIFFRQTRVGYKERLFDVIKFRTMCANAEKESGAVWARENDARVTRLGRLMRKFRIDELPQLFNVLKGEMSFIGPRPERPEFVSQLSAKIPYYSKRHSVRPGLTGWAQIKYPYGASEEDALEKLRYDLYFIKNFSIGLEMKIILGTFKVVLFGRGGR